MRKEFLQLLQDIHSPKFSRYLSSYTYPDIARRHSTAACRLNSTHIQSSLMNQIEIMFLF